MGMACPRLPCRRNGEALHYTLSKLFRRLFRGTGGCRGNVKTGKFPSTNLLRVAILCPLTWEHRQSKQLILSCFSLVRTQSKVCSTPYCVDILKEHTQNPRLKFYSFLHIFYALFYCKICSFQRFPPIKCTLLMQLYIKINCSPFYAPKLCCKIQRLV